MSHKFSNSFLVCVFAHSKVLIMQTAFQITDNDRKQASTSIDCSHWCRWHCGDPRRRHRTPSKRWKAKRVSRADRESERSRWLLSWSNKGEGFSGRRHRLGTLHSLSASASAGTAVRRCLEAAPTACRLLLPPQNKQGEWIDDWKTSDPRRRERERLHNMAAWRRGGRRVNVRSLGKVSVLRGLSAGRQAGTAATSASTLALCCSGAPLSRLFTPLRLRRSGSHWKRDTLARRHCLSLPYSSANCMCVHLSLTQIPSISHYWVPAAVWLYVCALQTP